MSTIELVEQIQKLPADMQKEVEKLISELSVQIDAVEADKKPRMKFGDLKGFVKHMSDDFDEPLEDLQE